MPANDRPMVEISNVSRRYFGEGGVIVHALRGVSFAITQGEFLAITGPSGCGKSTMLNLLSALDTPDEGEIRVGDTRLQQTNDRERTRYRREDVGIVFQFFNLLPGLTIEENVALPLRLAGKKAAFRLAKARELLDFVGLAARTRHFPHQLSGGEMQRAAVARALSHSPKLVIADEPTGNLDTEATGKVLELLGKVHAEGLTTLILVTHSEAVASAAKRRIRFRDGQIEADSKE